MRNIDGDTVTLGYSLGWNVRYYRNNYYLEHGGDIDGLSASVSLLPNENIGIGRLHERRELPAACHQLLHNRYDVRKRPDRLDDEVQRLSIVCRRRKRKR